MQHTLAVSIPDRTFETLRRVAADEQRTPEDVASDWLAAAVERVENDPVLKLLGSVRSDVTDVSERHDYYLGQALMAEMRGEEDA